MNTPQTPEHNQNPPPPGKHHWGMVMVILLVVIVGVVAWHYFQPKKTKQQVPPPISITVTNVQKGDIAIAVSSLGSVQPLYTATISPRVDGQVLTVNYTEGQMVASNDLLAVIDPGPFQAQVTASTGQLERDKALLEGAKIDLERYKAAAQKKAIPQQQVDDELALVHQDEGAVQVDQGQQDNAKVQLAYCYIRAPFAGRVGLRLIDPGNVVHAANTNAMVVVAQLQPITVVFNVAEDYLPQIQEQMKGDQQMTVEAWDRADEKRLASGKVLALNNLIDTSTGTIRIKALFANDDSSLFPNQFVNARLVIRTLHDRSLIPTFAIQHNPVGAFVYVVTNGTVTMRNITPGVADGNVTAVNEGLEPDDVIALDNFNKLGEGVKVATRKPGENQSGGDGEKHKGGHKKKPDEAKDGS